MEEGKEVKETEITQTRQPSDIEVFLLVLPNCVGSFAAKSIDAKSASDSAIILARETVGSLAKLGFCQPTVMCTDGQPLAVGIMAPAPSAPPIDNTGFTLGNGHSRQGAMVTQFANAHVQKIQGL